MLEMRSVVGVDCGRVDGCIDVWLCKRGSVSK